MKKKVYILLGIIIVNVLIFGGMKSYAAYKAKAEGELAKLNLAKFVFQNQQKQEIGLNISDMIPGDKVSYNFSHVNTNIQSLPTFANSCQLLPNLFIFSHAQDLPYKLPATV